MVDFNDNPPPQYGYATRAVLSALVASGKVGRGHPRGPVRHRPLLARLHPALQSFLEESFFLSFMSG